MSAVPIGGKRVREKYLGKGCRVRKADGCDVRGRVLVDSDSGGLFVKGYREDGPLYDGNTLVERLEGDPMIIPGDEISVPDPRWPGSLKSYHFTG